LAKKILDDLKNLNHSEQIKTQKWHLVSNMIESTSAIAVLKTIIN
jgi:hypothetical protein